MRKRLSNLLKISVTVLGLVIVLQQVDFNEIWNTLAHARIGWVLAGFALVNVSLAVRAYRWLLLLHSLGVKLKLSRLVELYFVGQFFNAFLPSGFGGDVVRVLEVARDTPAATATGTVFLDRSAGLIVLFLMALVAAPARPATFPAAFTSIIVIGAILGVAVGLILLEGRLLVRFSAWLPGPLSPLGDTHLAQLLRAVRQCGRRAIWGALAVSALFNLILAAWWWTSGLALGQQVPFSYYVLVMPILSVPLLIPSIGGLGPRELLAPTLFAVVGMTAEAAVSLSFLVFVINRLSGLMGAPVYIYATIRDGRRKRDHSSERLTNGL